jgi:hypothetical protein
MGLLSDLWGWGYGLFSYIIPFLFVLTIVVFSTNWDISWLRGAAASAS